MITPDRRRSPEDVREPDPELADFPDYDDAFLEMVNDMDVVPEDVRGADVGEARDSLAAELEGARDTMMVDEDWEPSDVAGVMTRAAAALRSPEPAAEPNEALEDGRVGWLAAWEALRHWARSMLGTPGWEKLGYVLSQMQLTEETYVRVAQRHEREDPPSAPAGGEPRYTLDEAADMLDAEGQRLLDERGEHYVGRWESAKWLRSVGEARTPNISGGNDLPDADGANPRTPKRADEREALSFPHAPYVWEHPNPGFGYEIRVADMTEDGYTTLAQEIPTSRIAHVFLAGLRSGGATTETGEGP
jgi:hypothetical protein